MGSIRDKWDEILNILKKEHDISDVSFKTWIAPLKLYSEENNTAVILVSDDHGQMGLDLIRKKYKIPMKVVISEISGSDYDVEFILSKDAGKPVVKHHASNVPGLNPRYTFDTFVVGNNNKFAHAASLAVAESPGDIYNPLFLYGGVGLGKTHLMHSIAHFISENDPDLNILYVTSEQFTNEVIEAVRNGNAATAKLKEKYRNIDVLLVDDIQFIIGKESTQEEFFNTFNSLHSAGKQIIISSDRPPKDMTTLEARVRSRFEWGLMADIQSPDFETRIAILQKKQEIDGFYVSQEVTEYIAENVKSNIRALEGSLNKVIALANIEKREVDLELVQIALKDIITPKKNKNLTPDVIIDAVAKYFDVSAEDIKGSKRNKKIVYTRQIAMYILRELTKINLQAIGAIMGGKDHTTIMYGINKIEESIESTPSVEEDIENIKKLISE